MPPPFQRLHVDQFAAVLKAFEFRRRITGVHMHHTWQPNHAQWRGHDSMVSMWRFHTKERGFIDIAQHITIDPEGQVWTGRNWNTPPASASGHNGTSVAGPFMFEMVGDFDLGRDAFAGAQRQTVLDVITLVQARFGLAPESLMFHNQAANKSCPGTAINYAAFLEEVRQHKLSTDETSSAARGRKSNRAKLELPPGALASEAFVQRTVQLIDREPAGSRSAAAAAEELGCEAHHHVDLLAPNTMPYTSRAGAPRGPDISAEQLDALRPHVLNLRMGRFSNEGLMTSSAADVDRIVHEHVAAAAQAAAARDQPLKVLLWAHGGLVKESSGLAVAARQVNWWKDNGVYPIHFVWETGLFESLRDLLERVKGQKRQRGLFSDHISDPLIEAGVRALQGGRIWGAMKASAQQASAPGGGAHVFLSALAALVKTGVSLELHAAGHSAGSIFHSHLLQAAAALGLPAFKSLQLMAPAVRADTFRELVLPLLGDKLGPLTVYTMRRDFERDDDCAKVYRKSLLYLVSRACENGDEVPILGLEDSLRADPALRTLFGLGSPPSGLAEVVWSKSLIDDGRSASRAIHHGDFDEDGPTMNSVMRRVLSLDDAAPLPKPFPPAAARSSASAWLDGPDWPEDLQDIPPLRDQPTAQAAPPIKPEGKLSVVPQTTASGRRHALCIGIDNYPTAPLAGCHQDARLWQQTLQALGFSADLLLDPDRQALVQAIEALFTSARSGDELVLQYAGHGTHVDDLDGDEADDQDEALCPLDFADGALFLDDDLGSLIDRIAPGVRLTLFMDCCHSGTNTRVASPRPQPGQAGARARFVRATPALQQAHRDWRTHQRGATPPRRSEPAELAFAACQDHEVAWESEGHGEFTLRATRLLAAAGGKLSARQLQQQVLAAFGPSPRQQPRLNGPDPRLDLPLFT